jgi:hypothetical protein
MNYVDPILRYLSGEFSPEEAKAFLESMNSNEELKQEFNEISTAYELIREQLVERDTRAFREKLLESMDREIQPSLSLRGRNRRWWLSLAALAATLAIVLSIWLKPSGKERLLSRFYTPDQDPVVLALQQDTRGIREEGVLYYRNERYREAMISLEPLVREKSGNEQILLFYLLSVMELDREDEIIEFLLSWEFQAMNMTDQALRWYASLALMKTDRLEESRAMLRALKLEPGPYQSDAENLLKLLLK